MTLGVMLFARPDRPARPPRAAGVHLHLGLAAIVLLLLPLLPGIGNDINGARIWIHVGPFSFQPGEVAKVLLVIAFAGYLVLHRDALALAGRRVLFVDLPRGRDLGPILAMWLVSLGILVFQRDLGSCLLFFGLFLVMLYVATERPGWLVVGGALFVGGALRGLQLVRPRPGARRHLARTRSTIRRDDDSVPAGRGDVRHGLGRARRPRPRQGQPRRVPFAESDFIVAVDRRGARPDRGDGDHPALRADRRARPAHGADLPRRLRQAGGDRLGGVVALQVFVVIGGVTRLIPLTGLTTPFLSYGGSSLVANWVIIALLLRISDQARRPVAVSCRARSMTRRRRGHPGGEGGPMNKPIRTCRSSAC